MILQTCNNVIRAICGICLKHYWAHMFAHKCAKKLILLIHVSKLPQPLQPALFHIKRKLTVPPSRVIESHRHDPWESTSTS